MSADINPESVREFFAGVQMLWHVMDMDESIGFVVVATDLETGDITVSGVATTPEEALIRAQQQSDATNRGVGENELGWKYTVHPLFPFD